MGSQYIEYRIPESILRPGVYSALEGGGIEEEGENKKADGEGYVIASPAVGTCNMNILRGAWQSPRITRALYKFILVNSIISVVSSPDREIATPPCKCI